MRLGPVADVALLPGRGPGQRATSPATGSMKRLYEVLYRVGITPWDSARIPGPLAAEVRAAAPGMAVDLGCGTGRQARHLAANGWTVTAVDFVPRALAMAAAADRAETSGQAAAGKVTWRLADVTKAAEVDSDGALARRVSLILDNGCMHGISDDGNPGAGRNGWARTVEHLAAPGCVLLVRAVSTKRPRRNSLGPAGTDHRELAQLLGGRWHLTGTPAPDWSRFTLDPAGTGRGPTGTGENTGNRRAGGLPSRHGSFS